MYIKVTSGIEGKESIPASMHFLAFAPAPSAVTFIEESPETTEERSPRYGVAAQEWNKGRRHVMLQQ